MTTIEQSVAKRRRLGIASALAFFIAVCFVASALFFAIYVAFPNIPAVTWKALLIVCGAVILFAFGGGWAARGLVKDNVDTLVRDWGPLTRKLFAERIAEEDEPKRKGLRRILLTSVVRAT